jgi:ribosome-associated protein
VIHLFTPDLREKYSLEELWQKGRIVDVDIVTERPGNSNG